MNGEVLKQTQIMFEYPQIKNADDYFIEITKTDNVYTATTNAINAHDSYKAHLVESGLEYGTKYYWRYTALKDKKPIYKSKQFTFTIEQTPLLKNFKANVTKNDSSKIEQGLIFLDNGIVMDRRGNLVLITDSFGVEKRDFTLTNENTLTYIQNNVAYETALNGKLLWKSKEIKTATYTLFFFHHDLIKLKNGNYLILCKTKLNVAPASNPELNEAIVELTKNNEIKWYWDERSHLPDTTSIHKSHLNSLFYNDSLNQIIVSSRDLNTLFFIDRSSGKIVKSIGYPLSNTLENYQQVLFSGQHSAQLLSNNNILLFNNNSKFGRNGSSSVLEIKQPTKENPVVDSDFLFLYEFEETDQNYCAKGGDANKLENGNYLISSSANNRNFEINKTKVLWECKPQKFDSTSARWIDLGSYRINFAKTLYPLFFCLETIYKNDVPNGFKIINKGSDNNTFILVIKTADNKKLINKSVAIKSNESISELLNLQQGKIYTLEVWPKDKPHFKKILQIKP